ncbi:alpha/beta hydrolase [Pantoea ananatis]|uniref:alpha/beta fold hydrolase n=1 Tax=Pantoea ananas TaxID=553 RepID=UPI00222381C6|nr:alpha/beta hydrolase [Pantoea ananatis]MCW1831024.1 alpha/beta hydrolase [Pantoea ananatis]
MDKSDLTETSRIKHGEEAFDVTLLQVKGATRCILFAAGLGGSPLRHLELLQTFARHGVSVVAPHFERLTSPVPASAELLERCQRLARAQNEFCSGYASVTGVGHSLGSVILLLNAGAVAMTSAGESVVFAGDRMLHRLILLAPPADFFQAPSALAAVNVPVHIWAGEKDSLTPPSQACFLKPALEGYTQTYLCVMEEAGHFTFMNTLPPQVTDSHPSRETFLLDLGENIARLVTD